jgi:hypothetical protein
MKCPKRMAKICVTLKKILTLGERLLIYRIVSYLTRVTI